jgi:hypothetical protein
MTGWVIGDGGTILHTANGGQSWEVQESGTSFDLNDICITDENNGWICGESGIILHTGNGGMVGTQEPMEVSRRISIIPNPSEGLTLITYNPDKGEHAVLTVSDAGGNELLRLETNPADQGQVLLDCSNFPPGLYLITIYSGHQKFAEKLLIR